MEISLLIVLIALIGAPSISTLGESIFHSFNRSTCSSFYLDGGGVEIDDVYSVESGHCFTDSHALATHDLMSVFF